VFSALQRALGVQRHDLGLPESRQLGCSGGSGESREISRILRFAQLKFLLCLNTVHYYCCYHCYLIVKLPGYADLPIWRSLFVLTRLKKAPISFESTVDYVRR